MKLFTCWKKFVQEIYKKSLLEKKWHSQKGAILIFSFMILIVLTSLVANYLFATHAMMKSSGFGEMDERSLWLAEAGLSKAIWNLMTPTGSGGQGENWTTPAGGTTQSLATGTYKMEVSRYDFALASNGATASDSPAQIDPTHGPAMAIDGDDINTYWESAGDPKNSSPQDLIIHFPYPLNIHKVRFISPSQETRPRDYKWYVSTDGNFIDPAVYEVQNNSEDCRIREDVFVTETNVGYLKLEVREDGQGAPHVVRISTLEVLGSKVVSTGTVNAISRKVSQTAAVLDGATSHTCFEGTLPSSQAYVQKDWTELAP